jgi:hypothetical protein
MAVLVRGLGKSAATRSLGSSRRCSREVSKVASISYRTILSVSRISARDQRERRSHRYTGDKLASLVNEIQAGGDKIFARSRDARKEEEVTAFLGDADKDAPLEVCIFDTTRSSISVTMRPSRSPVNAPDQSRSGPTVTTVTPSILIRNVMVGWLDPGARSTACRNAAISSCAATRALSIEFGAQSGTPSDVNAVRSARRSASRQISCAAARPFA